MVSFFKFWLYRRWIKRHRKMAIIDNVWFMK